MRTMLSPAECLCVPGARGAAVRKAERTCRVKPEQTLGRPLRAQAGLGAAHTAVTDPDGLSGVGRTSNDP